MFRWVTVWCVNSSYTHYSAMTASLNTANTRRVSIQPPHMSKDAVYEGVPVHRILGWPWLWAWSVGSFVVLVKKLHLKEWCRFITLLCSSQVNKYSLWRSQPLNHYSECTYIYVYIYYNIQDTLTGITLIPPLWWVYGDAVSCETSVDHGCYSSFLPTH